MRDGARGRPPTVHWRHVVGVIFVKGGVRIDPPDDRLVPIPEHSIAPFLPGLAVDGRAESSTGADRSLNDPVPDQCPALRILEDVAERADR